MSKINSAIHEIQSLDIMARGDRWVNTIHPLVKLCITIFYIIVVVSFGKYNIGGLLYMIIYPLLMFVLGDLSFRRALYRLKVVLPLVCIVGIFNPFFDTRPLYTNASPWLTFGVISMFSLMIKGILCVFAAYILIATTTIEKICYALRLLHLPKIFVTQILLIYRYITVLLKETDKVMQAYRLRAPRQKGIHFRTWGSLVGQMLLRSIDRADEVYHGMCLRGFNGEFPQDKKIRFRITDTIFLLVWIFVITSCRVLPLFEWIGGLFV